MSETEFVDRLQQELCNHQRWPDFRIVASAREDPLLAPNELLVYPVAASTQDAVKLRVTVECLTVPRGIEIST